MTKDAIIQSIIDYLQNDKANYAVMLYGEWGSGKTHLYKNYIKEKIRHLEYGKEKDKRRTEIYISLYGVSSVEDLTKEIILNFILKVKLNEDETKGKIFINTNKLVGIASKIVSFSVDNFSFDFGNIPEIIEENIDYKNMVICFDDLERCSIPINNLFGVINNLVEHCNCKVIIIADEDNIGKMYANTNIESKYMSILNGRKVKFDDTTYNQSTQQNNNEVFEDITIKDLKVLNEELYSENFIYKDIKEKVIGMSLKYDLDFEEEYEAVVDDSISGNTLKEFLTEQKKEILDCMDKCDNKNIRIMKNWLINYERIYNIVKKHYQHDKNYIDEINKKFMIYSIRVACALGNNKGLSEWRNDTRICHNVYLDDGYTWGTEGYWFIDRLFLTSTLDEKDVCHAANYIAKSIKEEEEKTRKYFSGECLSKLGSWQYLEDEEIEILVKGLIEEIKEQKYVYQHYQSIISLLVYLKSFKLYNGNINDVTDIMIQNIENEQGEVLVERTNIGFIDKKLNEEFDTYYASIDKLIAAKNHRTSERKMEDIILPNEENWAELFDKYCQERCDEFLKNQKFFQYIDVNLLTDKLKKSKTKDIYSVKAGIRHVYRFGNINEFYKGDIPKIKEFIELLKEFEWEGKTKKIAIKGLVDTLEEKLMYIEKSIY